MENLNQRRGAPEDVPALQTTEQEFTLEQDGFVGSLYRPRQDFYPGKAIMMFSGSDGMYSLTKLVAQQYVRRGLTVLALAYWRYPGLPNRFERIPIEILEKPALWLKANGYAKVGLWGISMGAEYALIAASLLPDLISCVVAVAPINIVGQGMDMGRRKGGQKFGLLPCSSWSFRGKELPYVKLRLDKRRIVLDSVKRRSACVRSCYEGVVESAPEEGRIKVERINGPILLLSAKNDDMWPAAEAGDAMMSRLDQRNFPWPHEHISYEYASHLLIPYKLKAARIFAVERKYPDKCMESNLQSFEKTLAFLKEQW